MTTLRYELIINWSKADEPFVVEVPELPSCVADGATYEVAVANALGGRAGMDRHPQCSRTFHPQIQRRTCLHPMHFFLRHDPSRGIGGEPKQREDSPPGLTFHYQGQTNKRETFARRAEAPSGYNGVNIIGYVCKYTAERGGCATVEDGGKSDEFVKGGAEVYTEL